MATEPLLIHPPPYLYSGADPFAGIGRVVPIGILSIAEYLSLSSWEPILVRLPVLARTRAEVRGGLVSEDWDELLRLVLDRHPARLIGIQNHWSQYSEGALEVARRIRSLDPNRVIVLGGVHAASLAREIVDECPEVDGVVVGEGERTMESLLERLHRGTTTGGGGTLDVPGLVSRGRDGEIVDGGPGELVLREQLPPIRFDPKLLEPPGDAHFVGVPVVRGVCPKGCTYCELNNRGLFTRKQVVLVETLAEQIEIATAKGVPIYLPENFVGAKPLAGLIEEISKAPGTVGPVYVDVHPDMLSESAIHALEGLVESGTEVRLWMGIESGSKAVRRLAGRKYSIASIMEKRDRLLAIGIRPIGSFLVGLPGEGAKDLEETDRAIRQWNESGLVADVFPALTFPGTKLFADPATFRIDLRIRTPRDFGKLSRAWFQPLETSPLTHTNGSLSDQEVVRSVLRLRLEQRDRLGLPITQESLSFMGHRAAPWSKEEWDRARERLSPIWPSTVSMPSMPLEIESEDLRG